MSIDQIVNVLNEAYVCDPKAMDALTRAAVPANERLANHPTIQVRCTNINGEYPVLRMLGLLNGIAAIEGQVIFAEFDASTNTLLGFRCMRLEDVPCR